MRMMLTVAAIALIAVTMGLAALAQSNSVSPGPAAPSTPSTSSPPRAAPAETTPAYDPNGQTWIVKSMYAYKVQLTFFSQDRNFAWPGGNEAYALYDSLEHTYNLSCRQGEKICYGAWPNGRSDIYWGVGADNNRSCSNCCERCGSGTIRRITLQ